MDMVKDLQNLISIPSIAEANGPEGTPFGKEVDKALCFVLDLCRSLGFRTKNCDGHIGWAEIGEGEEIFAILAHLDVVPPGSGWTYPPFSGELHNGKIYGRGTVDDKGPAMACIYAMKDLLESGVKLSKRVRIIFGMTEEDGDWLDMEYYKAHEEIPSMGFTPDADFPAIYGEKGILQVALTMQEKDSGIIAIQGGEAPNMVPDNCSIRLAGLEGSDEIAILKTGVSAHGSTPWDGENAVSKAVKAAYDLERAGKISSPFVRFYMEKIGFAIYGENINLGIEDKESGKLTFNAGTVKMTDDGTITLTADIRYPVTFHLDEVLARLKEGVKPYPVEVKTLAHIKPVYMNKDGQLIKTLMSAYRDITGDESEALVIGGGTYARAMDNIVAFGPLFSHREPTEHKKNEHIYVEDLVKIRRIYGLAIERLATGSMEI